MYVSLYFFQNSTKGSQSFSQDLLNTNRKSPLYFTALESPEKTSTRDAQIRSTISKVRNMYIGDQVDRSKKPSKSDAVLKSKMPIPMAPMAAALIKMEQKVEAIEQQCSEAIQLNPKYVRALLWHPVVDRGKRPRF